MTTTADHSSTTTAYESEVRSYSRGWPVTFTHAKGSTLTAALIPWTTTAIFYSAILGVSSLDYAPFALLNWMNPIIGIAMAWLGLGYLTSKVDTPSTD